ncbi:monofunctional biosynthetic peptidoglycan transglycosylase [Rubrivirga sp.]|uniref:monofunctional biosynthetic peptidoglycan transglycosylase n=1 Tax=Rubrivirga sp. TaxID=1885344 RepID=UPI003C75C0D8
MARRTRRRSRLWSVLRVLVGIVGGYLVACTVLLVAYRWVEPPATTVQLQRYIEAAVSGDAYDQSYRPVSVSGQDDDIRHAVVASEDARFYTHNGFDAVELRRARDEALAGGRVRGASTLTQQLVKNLFLTTHRSVVRKAFEVPLTFLAEWILPKDRLLTLYLNVAEWGPGIFGIEAAANHHYGTTAGSLSRDQAARLTAILPAPLVRRPQEQNRTSDRIQRRMREMGW